MPCTIELDSSAGVARVKLTGEFTPAEVIGAFVDAWQEPGWAWKAVVDVRDGFPTGWARADARSMVGLIARHKPRAAPRGRIVILVENDLDYGLSRVFQALAFDLPTDFRVTRSERDAIAWLQDQPTDEPLQRLGAQAPRAPG